MLKNRNKRRNFNDYQCDQFESSDIYSTNYNNKTKYSKNSNFYNNKPLKQYKYIKDYKSNVKYFERYLNFNDYDSFYPKNYEQKKSVPNYDYNKNELTKSCPLEQFKNFSKNEIFDNKKEKNFKKIGFDSNQISSTKKKNESHSKNNEDDINEKNSDNIKEKNEIKNSGIKSIPHPKRKKEHQNIYKKGKKNNFHQEKEEKNIFKKERKLSFSSSQNNDSTKQSVNTIDTSCFSKKEKDVSNDGKKETELNLIINNNLNNNFIKNKFDEENKNTESIEKFQATNKYLENTEVLQVKVKISENETATFKIKRFDDLFLTVSLFCEINSIDEKLMKPIIIKSLCALNTIYQVYNSNITKENAQMLNEVQKISNKNQAKKIS